jgi:plastocyanin
MSRSLTSGRATSRRGRRVASALVLAGTLAAASACGGSGSEDAAAPSSSAPSSSEAPSSAPAPADPSAAETGVNKITAVEADFTISVDEDSLTAGSYEIEVVNEGSASHDLVVERDGEDLAATEILAPGESATLTVDLEAGEYIFYCSVGNHRGMGMELTVDVA